MLPETTAAASGVNCRILPQPEGRQGERYRSGGLDGSELVARDSELGGEFSRRTAERTGRLLCAVAGAGLASPSA
jgi:hypothetical protein